MSNKIAVIWDCDKTLIDGYMQDPMFEEYNVDATKFWEKVNNIPKEYQKQGIKVNTDTFYINYFLRCIKKGDFPGLNNEKLREFGKKQKFYSGIPKIFEDTKKMLNSDSFSEYGIEVEHYIVSTGFAEVIKGSELMQFVDGVWGCELIEEQDEKTGETLLSEIAYTIDNTTKTRAIFEINKGISKLEGVDVNSKIPMGNRRVRFENMIYIADGPSDIPAFSVVNQNGGSTFAIYPKGDMKAMRQVEQMRKDGRVDMYAEADYSKNTTAYMWITNKIQEIADRILEQEKERILGSISGVPHHLV